MSWQRQVGLFFTIFFVYLVFTSREVPWTDAKRIHMVAESIVYRGAVDVQIATPLLRDGKFYALNPFLPTAIHIPGVFLHQKVEERWPWAAFVTKAFGSHLGPAFCGALACLLFALLCRDLGMSLLASNLSAIVLAFATMMAPYARSPYSEIVQVATFMGLFVWLLRVIRKPTVWAGLWVGFWAGMLINTKAIYLFAFPGAALFAGVVLYRNHGLRRLLVTLGWVTLGALPGLVMLLAYNYARTGSMTDIGYPLQHQSQREFVEKPLFGLIGLFLSPGKSVFLYNPPLIVALLALPHVLRTRGRDWLWLALFTCVPVVLFYSKFVFWSGDWCWGPRYLLFLIPLMLLPAAFLLDDLLSARRWRVLVLAGVVFLCGLAVQVVGSSMYWDHFIRIAQDVQRQWLGVPQRGGAPNPERGAGAGCDPCFEDFYGFNWLPALSPLPGTWWLLKHVQRGDTWEQAEREAPWHRYTTLKFQFAGSYLRARPDWWYLDWEGRLEPAGRMLMRGLQTGAFLSLVLWWWPSLRQGFRRLRRRVASTG
jgi:hypothetical protein